MKSFLLLFFDLLSMAIMASLYGAASWAGYMTYQALCDVLFLPLVIVLSVLAAILTLILLVGAAGLLLPRVKPGRYDLFKGAVFFSWALRSILRRALFAPVLKTFLFQFYTLRFLALRALGAKVAFGANMSSDVDLLDPWMLQVESGATIGTRCLVSGHFIDRGQLVLGHIEIGANTLLAAHVVVGPSVKIGRDARLLVGVALGVDVSIGDGAVIGAKSRISNGVSVAEGVKLGPGTYAHPGVSILDDTDPLQVIAPPDDDADA